MNDCHEKYTTHDERPSMYHPHSLILPLHATLWIGSVEIRLDFTPSRHSVPLKNGKNSIHLRHFYVQIQSKFTISVKTFKRMFFHEKCTKLD